MTYNEVIETIGSSTGDDWVHDGPRLMTVDAAGKISLGPYE